MRCRLNEIASVRAGYQFRTAIASDPAGDVFVIQGKDVDSRRGQIKFKRLQAVSLKGAREPESHFLKPTDILLMARGGRNIATLVGDGAPERMVAVASFHIISPDLRKVDPLYLTWQLNESRTRAFFDANTTGSTIRMLALEVVKRLELELPPLVGQHHIARLIHLIGEERSLLESIASERQRLLRAYIQQQQTGSLKP